MEVKIDIKDGAPLQEQSTLFQAWFAETWYSILSLSKRSNEDAENGEKKADIFDQFGRPHIWRLGGLTVEAIYMTQDVQHGFKHFLIYGTV